MNSTTYFIAMITILVVQISVAFYFLYWLHHLSAKKLRQKYPITVRISVVLPFSSHWRRQVNEVDIPIFDKMQKGFRRMDFFAIVTIGIQFIITLFAFT
jgi:hypothetical protein